MENKITPFIQQTGPMFEPEEYIEDMFNDIGFIAINFPKTIKYLHRTKGTKDFNAFDLYKIMNGEKVKNKLKMRYPGFEPIEYGRIFEEGIYKYCLEHFEEAKVKSFYSLANQGYRAKLQRLYVLDRNVNDESHNVIIARKFHLHSLMVYSYDVLSYYTSKSIEKEKDKKIQNNLMLLKRQSKSQLVSRYQEHVKELTNNGPTGKKCLY